MRNLYLFFAILLLFPLSVHAQEKGLKLINHQFENAVIRPFVYQVKTGANGELVAGGIFSRNSLGFAGNQTQESINSHYIYSFNSNGEIIFSTSFKGSQASATTAIKIAPTSGNIFEHASKLAAANTFGGAINKYAPNGNVIWSSEHVALTTGVNFQATGLALDGAENVYVAGPLGGNLRLLDGKSGAVTYDHTGLVVFKVAADGQSLLWSNKLEGRPNYVSLAEIIFLEVHPITGNLIMIGNYRANFDANPGVASDSITTLNLPGGVNVHIFYAEYNPNTGDYIRGKRLTAGSENAGATLVREGLKMMSDGSFYISGTVTSANAGGAIEFDPENTGKTISHSSFNPSNNEAYIAKFDANAEIVWVKSMPIVSVSSIDVNSEGILVSGTVSNVAIADRPVEYRNVDTGDGLIEFRNLNGDLIGINTLSNYNPDFTSFTSGLHAKFNGNSEVIAVGSMIGTDAENRTDFSFNDSGIFGPEFSSGALFARYEIGNKPQLLSRTDPTNPYCPNSFATMGASFSGATQHKWRRSTNVLSDFTSNFADIEVLGNGRITLNGINDYGRAQVNFTIETIPNPYLITRNNLTLSVNSNPGDELFWQKNGQFISFANNPDLDITENGTYSVIIQNPTNPCDFVASFVVNDIPANLVSLTNFPDPVCPNSELTFEAIATNVSRYEWLIDGVLVEDHTSNTLTVNVGTSDIVVRLVLYDALFNSFATDRFVSVNNSIAPIEVIVEGNTLIASSVAGLIRWYKDGVEIEGANTSTLNVPAAGNYRFETFSSGCLVSSDEVFAAPLLYASHTVRGSGDGSSWDNSSSLQAAIDAIPDGGIIFLEEGHYLINESGTGAERINILNKSLSIKGGIPFGANFASSRSYNSYSTLDGLHGSGSRSRTILFMDLSQNNNIYIEHLIIKNGEATNFVDDVYSIVGAGAVARFFGDNASLEFYNSTFENNIAEFSGAISMVSETFNAQVNVKFINTRFINNSAFSGASTIGMNSNNSSQTNILVVNSLFVGNNSQVFRLQTSNNSANTFRVGNSTFINNSQTIFYATNNINNRYEVRNSIFEGNTSGSFIESGLSSSLLNIENSSFDIDYTYPYTGSNVLITPSNLIESDGNYFPGNCTPGVGLSDNDGIFPLTEFDLIGSSRRNNFNSVDWGAFTAGIDVGTYVGPLIVTNQPAANQNLLIGSTLELSLTATGNGLNFTWRKPDGTIQSTNSSLTFADIQMGDGGTWTAEVSNSCQTLAFNIEVDVQENFQIASQSSSREVCFAENVTLEMVLNIPASVDANDILYVWTRNGVEIPNENGPELALGVFNTTDLEGEYLVTASLDQRSVTSAPIVLTLSTASTVSFLNTFSDLTICKDQSESITPILTGADIGVRYSVQWYKNGIPMSGVGATLVLPGDASSVGLYKIFAKANNQCGGVFSDEFEVSLAEDFVFNESGTGLWMPKSPLATNPNIIERSGNFCLGNTIPLGISASGTGLVYSWKFNDEILIGETSSSLEIANLDESKTGVYEGLVTDQCGNEGKLIFTLGIRSTELSNQTQEIELCAGSTFNTELQIIGDLPEITWYAVDTTAGSIPQRLVDFDGETLFSFSFDGTPKRIFVEINNQCAGGSFQRDIAILNQSPSVSLINAPEEDLLVCLGENLNLTLSAQNATEIQWFKDGVAIPRATSATLALESIAIEDAGKYYARISNVCGGINTTSFQIKLRELSGALVASNTALEQSVCNSEMLTFTFNYEGAATNLSYQWYANGELVEQANSNSISISAGNNENYFMIASDGCAILQSATINLEIKPELSIDRSGIPAGAEAITLNVCDGETLNLNVNATGASPLQYVWKRNGQVIGNAIAASLQLENISQANAGTYQVDVSDACGQSATLDYIVQINTPIISNVLENLEKCVGDVLTLNLSFSGAATAIRWYAGNNLISGQNSEELSITLSQSQISSSLTISAEIENACGISTRTAIAVVNLVGLPEISTQPQAFDLCSSEENSLSIEGTLFETVQWMLNDEVINGANQTSLEITTAGTYFAILSNCAGSIESERIVISSNEYDFEVSEDINICAGDVIILQATGQGEFVWTNNVVNGEGFSPASTTTYTVTGTISSGCTLSKEVTVTVNELPNPEISRQGNSINTGNFASYQWLLEGQPLPGATSQSFAPATSGNYAVRVSNAAGCFSTSESFTFNVEVITSVAMQKGILLYPNPAQNSVQLDWQENTVVLQIQIIDLNGREVMETKPENRVLDISHLKNGIYYIIFKTNEGNVSKKLIKY